jgi:hypothetical protein
MKNKLQVGLLCLGRKVDKGVPGWQNLMAVEKKLIPQLWNNYNPYM